MFLNDLVTARTEEADTVRRGLSLLQKLIGINYRFFFRRYLWISRDCACRLHPIPKIRIRSTMVYFGMWKLSSYCLYLFFSCCINVMIQHCHNIYCHYSLYVLFQWLKQWLKHNQLSLKISSKPLTSKAWQPTDFGLPGFVSQLKSTPFW